MALLLQRKRALLSACPLPAAPTGQRFRSFLTPQTTPPKKPQPHAVASPGGDGRGTGHPRASGRSEQNASVGLLLLHGPLLAHPPDRNDGSKPSPTGTVVPAGSAILDGCYLAADYRACACRRDHHSRLSKLHSANNSSPEAIRLPGVPRFTPTLTLIGDIQPGRAPGPR